MPKADQDITKILSKNLFPVVGIGASAGGLAAFKKLVKAIPENSGMAYILVQHLRPDHSTFLPEILQRETKIPVHEIIDNMEVRPDQVYVIPANKILVANDGVLHLSPRSSKNKKYMPIDIFFSSLAEVHQGHAIGIILSGNGADGTAGLKNIKGQGGITFAQNLDSAAYDAMPQSAINAQAVDFILAPEKMPQQLLDLQHTANRPAQKPGSAGSPELFLSFEKDKKIYAKKNITGKHTRVAFEEKEKRATELSNANIELAFQNNEKEKRAAELSIANIELAFQNSEKEQRAKELMIANKELAFQNKVKEKRAKELVVANKELAFQNDEKEKRAAELSIANKELAFQNKEKEKRAAELGVANIELAFQDEEKGKRAAELTIANIELAFQNDEKEKRAEELTVANVELAFQNKVKEKRAKELIIANKELAFQNDEKEKRAAELIIANKELAFQNKEKEKRAEELTIANIELAFQDEEKGKRAAELSIANIELAFQNDEKEKRAEELTVANVELAFQNKVKEKRAKELIIANKELAFQNDEKEKRAAELIIANKELAFQNKEKEKRAAELVILSEELQNLNEELEDSKEVLESTNEELITVNHELFDSNEQHNKARLYAEAIFTTIHEPLLILNQDFRVKSANESFYKKFGLTQKETEGNVLFELQNNGWDIPGLRGHLLQIQKGNGKFLDWEVTYTFPLAKKLTICFKAQPFQEENGENWILLAFDDITIRKEKEKSDKHNSDELIKVLENIPQITLTTSATGSITYFNKFFLDYSGMTFDEALKKGWEPLIKPEMLEEFKESWNHVLKTGEDLNMELQLKKKTENTYRWHLYRASPIRDNEGVISSWVGAATDLQDQKTREQVKDEFISIASHELKTPLTSAKAYVQLLQMGMEETNNPDLVYAQKAGASINRLNDLIGELLDVSKIQNGKLSLNITKFDFNEMMCAAIEDVQCASPTHNIIKKGDTKQAVTGDKERLQQVVINLLSNAIKYSPEANKVLVTVAEKNGTVTVSVKDRGIGIRKENLWKIFERYYREEERAIHFQGLGIGLYISYEIVQRHRGKLWAEINGGRGSTFHFTIPI